MLIRRSCIGLVKLGICNRENKEHSTPHPFYYHYCSCSCIPFNYSIQLFHTLPHIVLIGLFLYVWLGRSLHFKERAHTHTFMVPDLPDTFFNSLFLFRIYSSCLHVPSGFPVILTTNHAIILLTLTCSPNTTCTMRSPSPCSTIYATIEGYTSFKSDNPLVNTCRSKSLG